jgi:predicted amidohydrolase YtcJ
MIPVLLMLCADLVLRNGKIVTLDASKPQVEAMAITGGKIVAVGTNAQMAREIQPSTKVIDLNGRLAIPGFIEGHGHFMGVGESKLMLNLRDAKNWEQIVAMVAAAAKEAKPGEWIVGRGWHQEKWDARPSPNVNGFPVNTTLNAVSPNNPVFLEHVSGHAAFVNDAALKRAGITRDTPNPPGGDITKDSSGRPIGLLNERAQGLVKVERDGQAEKAIDLAAEECVSKGITSFEDAGSPVDVIDRLKKRAGDGTLPLRLWVMLRVPNSVIAEQAAKIRVIGYGDNHFTVRAIKKQIDGALGSRGAWLLQPYSDLPSTSGMATETPEEIERTARLALANGYQMCVHAIGDRANREVLNVYQKVLAGRRDLRWRIEHAQHIDPADIPRFAQLGVFAMMQGIHCTSDAPMVIPRLGAKRAEEGAYVWQSLIKSGAHVGNGTDAPVEDVSPIASYYASVTRLAKDGKVFYPAQRMSRMEALRSYTVENAFAAFEENLKGTLKVAMLGDVTVLSQDILTVPEDRILKTEVEYTIVGGKIVYQKGQSGQR